MYVFTEIADDFDAMRVANHKFLDQTWNDIGRDWDAYIAAHGDDSAFNNALHNVMVVGEYAGIAAVGLVNDVAGALTSGVLDFLRIGDGVKKGGWGYAQDALRLLMVAGPVLRLAGAARIGLTRVFQIDPGGNTCTLIAARAALMLTGVRHFASLERVFQIAGTEIAAAEEFEGLGLDEWELLLKYVGLTVNRVTAVASTVEEALLTALADNPRTIVAFGVRWLIPTTKFVEETQTWVKVEEPVGHAMVAMRDAITGALKIFDRSRGLAFSSLRELEAFAPGYGPISTAELAGILKVENSTIVNILETGIQWAVPISGVAATIEAIEQLFPNHDERSGVRSTNTGWFRHAIAAEVRSVPFRVETHQSVHVPLRATADKGELVPQVAHWRRDLMSDGIAMGWTEVDVEYRSYKVQEGDSLWTVAKRAYGDGRLWKWIAMTNGISARQAGPITPGRVLKIEPLDLAQRLSAPVPEGTTPGPWLLQP